MSHRHCHQCGGGGWDVEVQVNSGELVAEVVEEEGVGVALGVHIGVSLKAYMGVFLGEGGENS